MMSMRTSSFAGRVRDDRASRSSVARGVTRRFGGLVALDGVDLDVPRGIVQAIIGPNGSGKTTLLNALSGASHADAGSIRIDGAEIFRLKPHRIARLGLARTFQNIRIFGNLSRAGKRQGRRRLPRADPRCSTS